MKSAVQTEWRAAAWVLYAPRRCAPICAEQHRLTLDMQAIKVVFFLMGTVVLYRVCSTGLR